MKLKTIFICLLGINILTGINAQSNEIDKLDLTLTQEFNAMMKVTQSIRFDSLAPIFKRHLKEALEKPQNFDIQFDKLSTRIKIIESPDENLRFYSWDERTGGTWHAIIIFAQFLSANCDVNVKQIGRNASVSGEFTDAIIREIHELEIEGKTHYLTMGWGTHGGGHHHNIVQIFTIENNKLINCKDCFEIQENLVIQAPRSNKINLKFHPENMEITHHEFSADENTGFYRATGNIVSWKLIEGEFKKQ